MKKSRGKRSEEKIKQDQEKDREQVARRRENMSDEQRKEIRETDKKKKAAARENMTEEQLKEFRATNNELEARKYDNVPEQPMIISKTAAERKRQSRAKQSKEKMVQDKARNRQNMGTSEEMAKTRKRLQKHHKIKMDEKKQKEEWPEAPQLCWKSLYDWQGGCWHSVTETCSIASPSIEMKAVVKCFPCSSFMWFKDGIEIVPKKGRIKCWESWEFKTVFGLKRCSTTCLQIERPTLEDAGIFTVKATNQHGENEYTFNVNFTPKVIEDISEQEVTVKDKIDTLTLKTKVSGGKIRWFKDGVLLQPINGKLRMYVSSKDISTLEFKSCTMLDAGIYIGKVITKAGACETSPCNVTVI